MLVCHSHVKIICKKSEQLEFSMGSMSGRSMSVRLGSSIKPNQEVLCTGKGRGLGQTGGHPEEDSDI